jgi:hypothetical protein
MGHHLPPPVFEESLKILVGAGRFERPTPCAQGGLQRTPETAYFQFLTFQAVAEKPVELCCFLLSPEAFDSYKIDYSHGPGSE